MIYLIVIGFIVSGIFFCKDINDWVNKFTEGIETDWLKTTLRIILKIIGFALIAVGALCAIICMVAVTQEPKKGKGK